MINKKGVVWGSVLALALLSGCKATSANVCNTTDWYNLGYDDGVTGGSANLINEYRLACANVASLIDSQAWQTGFDRGNLAYCQPDNGYRMGFEGHGYSPVCDNASFLLNYEAGQAHYLVRQEVMALEHEIAVLRERLMFEPFDDVRLAIMDEIDALESRIVELTLPEIEYEIVW